MQTFIHNVTNGNLLAISPTMQTTESDPEQFSSARSPGVVFVPPAKVDAAKVHCGPPGIGLGEHNLVFVPAAGHQRLQWKAA